MNNTTPTKRQIFDACKGQISKTAIRKIDGEWQLVGKYCRISWVNDEWDVLICNSTDLSEGLSQRKLLNIIEKVKKFPINQAFTILEGEAYSTDIPITTILKCIAPLGIRKQRTLSAQQKSGLLDRLTKSKVVA